MAQQLKDAAYEVFYENPVGPWIVVGSSLRAAGAYCIGLYKPLYFSKVYPEFIDEFSIGNALVYGVIATFSSLLGGYISDKFEGKTYKTMSYLCIGSTLLATPAMMAVLLVQDDFYFSLTMMGLYYVISETWISPGITQL